MSHLRLPDSHLRQTNVVRSFQKKHAQPEALQVEHSLNRSQGSTPNKDTRIAHRGDASTPRSSLLFSSAVFNGMVS